MHQYIAYYEGLTTSIEAESLYAAKLKAVAHFGVKAKKQHLVSVHLVKLAEGTEVMGVLA